MGKKISLQDAVLISQAIIKRYEAHDIDFIHTEPSTCADALRLLATGVGKPSFVDCLVMTLAYRYETPYIFGFDATFQKNGYRLPGDHVVQSKAA